MLTQAYYQFPKAGRAWESAAEQTQWSIRTYSELWMRYPYPQATSVAGPVAGMEYPMFVMVGYGTDDPASIFGTIDHEQGHEWFPMIVGSNERRYAWMDEGFNTYQNAFSNERRMPGSDAFPAYMANWHEAVDDGTQSPLMTPPDRIDADGARRDRLSQSRRGAARAARQRHRSRGDGSRDARVRATVGVQASHAGRLLPHRRERLGRRSVVVLELVLLWHGRARHRARRRVDATGRRRELSPRSTFVA